MMFRVRVLPGAGCALLAAFCLSTLPLGQSTHAAPQNNPPATVAPAPTAPVAAVAVAPAANPHKALLDRYCLTCHTQRLKERGTVPIALDGLDLSRVGADAETWEKVVLKLRAGLMPPAGAPRPEKGAHDALTGWLESELDRNAAARLNPGRTEAFHRLNRAEYRNAIRDILDLDVDVAALLPADDVSYGFDNIAGVLKMSPTLMERYLATAQKVSRLAVGTPLQAPNIDYFRVTDDLSQDEQLPGLPLGTRGGTLIRYTFPMDGVYEIRPRLTRDLNESVPLYTEDQHLEISIDGERVGTFTLPGIGGRAPAEASPSEAPEPQPPAPGSGTQSPGSMRSLRRLRIPNPEPRIPRLNKPARRSRRFSRRCAPGPASARRATVPTSRGTCVCR